MDGMGEKLLKKKKQNNSSHGMYLHTDRFTFRVLLHVLLAERGG